MNETEARRALTEVAANWASGVINAIDVVDVAAEALVAGTESTNLVLLAGTTRAEADVDVPELLPQAMDELHLPYFGWGQPGSHLIAAAALAREHVGGRLPARDLCRMIHSRFGHDTHGLVEPLTELDDRYNVLPYDRHHTEAQLDQLTTEAAVQLVVAADRLLAEPRP